MKEIGNRYIKTKTVRDIKDRNEHIYLILTRSTVKRLQTVEPPGNVIRNTMSLFYSSTDRHEKKMVG